MSTVYLRLYVIRLVFLLGMTFVRVLLCSFTSILIRRCCFLELRGFDKVVTAQQELHVLMALITSQGIFLFKTLYY